MTVNHVVQVCSTEFHSYRSGGLGASIFQQAVGYVMNRFSYSTR
jgi:hypothetical protein